MDPFALDIPIKAYGVPLFEPGVGESTTSQEEKTVF